MRPATRAILPVLLAVLAACQGGTGTPAPSASGVGASQGPDATAPRSTSSVPIPTLPPSEPVDVTVTPDTARTSQAVITPDGGNLTATGADGTTYALEIPEGALRFDLEIGVTPLAGIEGMPFGGSPLAVQLSPDGLRLINEATLTITPRTPIPADQQIGFSYLGNGQDVIVDTLAVDTSEIKLAVSHFSGYGVAPGSAIIPGAQEALDSEIAQGLGGTLERQLRNRISILLRIARQAQLLGEAVDPELWDKIGAILDEYEQAVLKPRYDAIEGDEDCDRAELAVQSILSYEHDLAILGLGTGSITEKWPRLFDRAALACVREEFKACVQYHRIFLMLPVYDRVLQMNASWPLSKATLEEARDLTVKCLTFKLVLDSTARLDIPYGGYVSTVEAEITLKYKPTVELINGFGPYVNTSYSLFMGDCGVTTQTGGGTLAVLGLLYEVEAGAPDADGGFPDAHVSDITIVYSPDNSTEQATISCPNSDPLPFNIPAWSLAFFDARANEIDEGGLRATKWDMRGGELFAEKEWHLLGQADPNASEEGSFELHHTPGA